MKIYHFQYKKKEKTALNYPKSAAMGFFKGTQEQVLNSYGKRAISVQATEVLLYIVTHWKYGEIISVSISKSLSLRSRTRWKSVGTAILKHQEHISNNSLETVKWFKTNTVFASK